MNDHYIVYDINFSPDPVIQNGKSTFHSEQDARKHIQENMQNAVGNYIVIVKQTGTATNGELIDIILKPK